MIPNAEGLAAVWLTALRALALISMGLAAIRLLRGPTLTDRVIALDLLVIAAVAVVALQAWHLGHPALLDFAVGVAMVTFISAIALAWYLERRGDA